MLEVIVVAFADGVVAFEAASGLARVGDSREVAVGNFGAVDDFGRR